MTALCYYKYCEHFKCTSFEIFARSYLVNSSHYLHDTKIIKSVTFDSRPKHYYCVVCTLIILF